MSKQKIDATWTRYYAARNALILFYGDGEGSANTKGQCDLLLQELDRKLASLKEVQP